MGRWVGGYRKKATEMGHWRRFRVEISPLESSLKRGKRNKMGERAGACRHRFPFPRLLRLCNLSSFPCVCPLHELLLRLSSRQQAQPSRARAAHERNNFFFLTALRYTFRREGTPWLLVRGYPKNVPRVPRSFERRVLNED